MKKFYSYSLSRGLGWKWFSGLLLLVSEILIQNIIYALISGSNSIHISISKSVTNVINLWINSPLFGILLTKQVAYFLPAWKTRHEQLSGFRTFWTKLKIDSDRKSKFFDDKLKAINNNEIEHTGWKYVVFQIVGLIFILVRFRKHL